MNIYSWFHYVWKNFPRGVTTCSQCECGRAPRRGSYPCVRCLCDKLTDSGKVNEELVEAFITQVRVTVQMEAAIATMIGEDTEL